MSLLLSLAFRQEISHSKEPSLFCAVTGQLMKGKELVHPNKHRLQGQHNKGLFTTYSGLPERIHQMVTNTSWLSLHGREQTVAQWLGYKAIQIWLNCFWSQSRHLRSTFPSTPCSGLCSCRASVGTDTPAVLSHVVLSQGVLATLQQAQWCEVRKRGMTF